jgi:16S rRNA (cytidine1402-2'-O)-methyltransferase
VVFFEAPHRIRATLTQIQQAAGDRPVMVARELTKAHEELVRGPISEVVRTLGNPQGEYTVVLDIGHTTDLVARETPSPERLLDELGEMTLKQPTSRRRALNIIAKRHSIPPNEVYAAIERAKKSGK